MVINVGGETKQVAIPMGTLEVYKELIKMLDAEEVGKIIDHVNELGLTENVGDGGTEGVNYATRASSRKRVGTVDG